MNNKDSRIKLILLGDSGVGKTAIIRRYHEDKFSSFSNATTSANFLEKELIINDQKIILELWDTAGQEEYRSLTKVFIKNSKIIILVYDVTSLESFNSLKFWYDFIKKEIGKEIVLGLAGNKTDLIFENDFDEEVSPEKGKEFAQKIGASFSLISAKESSNEIKALFNELLMKYLNNKEDITSLSSTIKLSENSSVDNNIMIRKNECCLGKNKKSLNLNMVFIGCNGVGKTSIIKTLKGNNDIHNLPHTKKNYNENIQYTKHGTNITVFLKDTNGNDYTEIDLENDIKNNKVFFFVFDINKIKTLYAMEKYIKKIDINKNKVYLLAYNNTSKEIYRSESECSGEIEEFAKKYECEYEFISTEDIYKLKALIIDNIGKYLKTVGY